MIASLPERIAALPTASRAACERLLDVATSEGRAEIPAAMEPWVAQRFGELEAVRRQLIVRVQNRYTLEGALFSPLRARRPTGEAADDAELEAWVARELAASPMFADPLALTTADVFGRIRGRFCVSAANVAKYDGWHGLVIFDEAHPLRFDAERLADYLDVALRWIARAHDSDPAARFPLITWNCLPKSGATIVHGHMQVALAHGAHYARPELWRRAAAAYRADHGRDYFADLWDAHAALGLGLHEAPGLRALAHLTPLRNRELVVMSADAGRLAGILAPLLRALIDELGVRSFNLAVVLPPLDPTPGWEGVPIVARVADRGPALTTRNDWGAMELYGMGIITADPFELVAALGGAAGRMRAAPSPETSGEGAVA